MQYATPRCAPMLPGKHYQASVRTDVIAANGCERGPQANPPPRNGKSNLMRLNQGEIKILETDATLFKPLRALGLGRAYLTSDRLVWKSTMAFALRLFSFFPPREVVIDLDSIRHVRFLKSRRGSRVIITVGWTDYVLFAGSSTDVGFLRKNPETTEQWYEALKDLGMKAKE